MVAPVLTVLILCACACVGVLMRWGLQSWLNPGGLIPWGTLAVNLIGGYLIGLCIGIFQAMPDIDPIWRLAIVTGFLGTLTTFSSFSGEVVTMLLGGRYAMAAVTIAVHLAGSLALTVLGIRTVAVFVAR